MNDSSLEAKTILGFDPGRDKCGVAVMDEKQTMLHHQVVDADQAISVIVRLVKQHTANLIVMGDGTTSKTWQKQIEYSLRDLPIVTVNEANSTLEARDRYWLMYPAQGLKRLIPQGLRTPPCPVDDIVAILLIERYLASSSVDND